MNKRKHERVRVTVPLYISSGDSVYRRMIPLETRDVSEGGVCFVSAHKVPFEARSKVVIGRIGSLPESALIEGRVVYLRRLAQGSQYAVGVEFERFVNTSREELLDQLATWKFQASPHRY